MASFFSGGKASDDKDKLAKHNAILAAHGHAGYGPSGGASPSSKKKSGGGGKGSGEPAKPKYDTKSKDFADVLKKKNEDGKFGYGYVDANTGVEVPWYIDMINGGGANAAGPEFVSPFADAPMGGGMAGIASQGVTGVANALPFITPYGSEQARPYAQAGMVGYDHLGDQSKPKPSGGGSPAAATPAFVSAPTTNVSIGQGNTTPLSYGDQRPPEAIGVNEILLNRNRGFHPTISPLTMPAASVSNPNYATYEGNPVPQMATPSLFSSGVNATDFTPALDPAMFGSDSTASTDAGRIRMDNMNTVPSEYAGTKLEAQYERYLRAGGQKFFPEFRKGLGAK